jgi:hypothetical protein
VSDDCWLTLAKRVHQPHDIAGEMEHAVSVDRLGAISLAVAAPVGRDDAEAGVRERRQLIAP